MFQHAFTPRATSAADGERLFVCILEEKRVLYEQMFSNNQPLD
jgi:hypothetical protein